MQTTHNGHTYQLTKFEIAHELPNLRAEILRNGFDGNVYLGISNEVSGNEVSARGVNLSEIFYRVANSAQFVCDTEQEFGVAA